MIEELFRLFIDQTKAVGNCDDALDEIVQGALSYVSELPEGEMEEIQAARLETYYPQQTHDKQRK